MSALASKTAGTDPNDNRIATAEWHHAARYGFVSAAAGLLAEVERALFAPAETDATLLFARLCDRLQDLFETSNVLRRQALQAAVAWIDEQCYWLHWPRGEWPEAGLQGAVFGQQLTPTLLMAQADHAIQEGSDDEAIALWLTMLHRSWLSAEWQPAAVQAERRRLLASATVGLSPALPTAHHQPAVARRLRRFTPIFTTALTVASIIVLALFAAVSWRLAMVQAELEQAGLGARSDNTQPGDEAPP